MFSFIKNRPPLVVFFLCVATLTVTISCFAFYIKNTDLVPDSDRNHDWTDLIAYFNALDVCVELEDNTENKKSEDDNFVEMTKVQTLISINNTDIVKKLASVRGFLTLENWHTNCPKNNPKPSNMQIYFDVPKSLNPDVAKFDICVMIEGPEEYLPRFSEPNCNITSQGVSKKAAFLSTNVKTKHDETFCKTGSLVKLEFYPQPKDNLANFLSDGDKSVIYFHLLWTSYVLLFVLLIIAVYGTLHSDYFYDSLLHKWIPFQKQ